MTVIVHNEWDAPEMQPLIFLIVHVHPAIFVGELG